MIQNAVVPGGGEKGGSVAVSGAGAGGGRTVLVGVKLDAPSRELLTWALVKVAEPGDTVIALHVLGNEIVDRAGTSSLLSLVKTFDSVLEVYEGFCNLKQVDLKLKLCRGSSIRKILVREAKSFSAAKVIVGISRHHHAIRSSASVAKYCAKKLTDDCWVLAVNNGKIVFQKEGSTSPSTYSQGKEEIRRNTLFNAFQQPVILSKSNKVASHSEEVALKEEDAENRGECQNLGQALAASRLQNCTVCGSGSLARMLSESSNLDGHKNQKSLAIVHAKNPEDSSGSITMLVRQLPESRPGWPLLRRAVVLEGQASPLHRSSLRQIPVVKWALKLPSRNISFGGNSVTKEICLHSCEDESPSLNAQTGAMVPVGISSMIPHSSPDNSPRRLPVELEGLHEKYSSTCRFFKYKELVLATWDFSAGNFIGKGGSSRVFKGFLPSGREVAVKILKQNEDVLKEFVSEIDIITTLNHKNIISLLGFCFEDNNLLLVYNYLSRGSLEENLHGYKKDPFAFCWRERYKVAVGVAEALDYLHNHASQPVIHRDVKSSNILLSDNFDPELSDFGLAKWASTSSTHEICSDVFGTFGYLAPEYFMYGKVNDKIDVYAFGVVLLELLSGRKPISNESPKVQTSLVMWAKPILDNGKYSQLLDPSLRDNYEGDQMELMAMAATLCIRHSPQARPKMSMVLKLLKGDEDALTWARQQLNNPSEDSEVLKDEKFRRSNLQSHLNLALLDVEDDSLSMGSIEQSISVEDYLKGRTSRSPSFD
ncbi:PREDICTED: probable receptor-like serine/threonine-protein kinase At5g57670 [Tarenaya hassleriana]|uniref:probable receptor-like serine/threonine-protein kinase At5g57670 n=1 Tax=Tarenaya hassleriana TaxID=28532 RepID=UPI00053C140F|nr:PREDICTED: probable receptor-like serine/threonine-protein kinase At5g57670 [Tarenaya hassleriana]